MITTLVMKILSWVWNYTPTTDMIEGMIIFAILETILEIMAFFTWKTINKGEKDD